MMRKVAIHWFRQDLRLSDNPALSAAGIYQTILPIYILDEENAGSYAMGSASRWWLHHSLSSLDESLNGTLSVYKDNPLNVFDALIARFDICAIHWN